MLDTLTLDYHVFEFDGVSNYIIETNTFTALSITAAAETDRGEVN